MQEPAEPIANTGAAGGEASPMLAQYLAIKALHPEYLLFYRMGDFYELFFEDAKAAATALDIVLTKRGRHRGADIPMCGVPVHAYESNLERLIRRGFKVAVCEQVENPREAKKRGAKAVVKREVVRLVTPGTLTEEALLDARDHNYLAAVGLAGGETALAWLDLSTGAFSVEAVAPPGLAAALARLAPGEILVSESLIQRCEWFEAFAEWKSRLTVLPSFDSVAGERALQRFFGVATLDSFGDFGRAELASAGALAEYVERTQMGQVPRLAPPSRIEAGAVMAIDAATRRNLELARNLGGERAGTLLAAIDRTLTGAGARLLAARLSAPLTDPGAIRVRLDDVAFFAAGTAPRETIRERLRRTPEIERALTRCTAGRGGPRDLAAIREGLRRAGEVRELLAAAETPPAGLQAEVCGLGRHAEVVARLDAALAADLPHLARDGGFIARDYHARLDELRALRDESRRHVLNLQARYAEETGVAKLKIKHNRVLGYFVEVTSTHADRLMGEKGGAFIHRQTMAGAVRFSTADLGELERAIADAAEQALGLELALFDDLVAEVRQRASDIARAAAALAAIDVVAALAETAAALGHVRPVVDDSLAFRIEGGRHPVVEAALAAADAGPFVPNDCDLGGEARLWLLTGPNMAGKSTFLRQNALIAVLAQTGAFVPAVSAHLGVIDRLFSRVGAADDLTRGRSTFMVEMVETASILNQATGRSLVILDEIGRGTATFDGLSIAWAVIEHLHEANRCRALFATHYHELTALAGRLKRLANYTVRVKEWQDDVVFLHEVAPGAAEASYGIQVARLAGLPQAVLERAGAVLHSLEEDEPASAVMRLANDLPLFSSAPRETPAAPSAAFALLDGILPDELSPKEALELLYRLKALRDDGDSRGGDSP